MALFDNMQKTVVQITERVFGDLASWINSEGVILYEGLVYFANPEKIDSIGDTALANYSPYDVHIEFFVEQFIGLKDSVDEGNIEKLTIKGDEYFVRSIMAISDGKMFIATLQKKTV